MNPDKERLIHHLQGALGHLYNMLDGTSQPTQKRLAESAKFIEEAINILHSQKDEQ